MSTASKVTLALTTLGSLGVIYSVHKNQVSESSTLILLIPSHICTQNKSSQTGFGILHVVQVEDRAKLHDGIVRDLERQAKKKVVNQQLLVQQQELTKLYRKAEEKDTSE